MSGGLSLPGGLQGKDPSAGLRVGRKAPGWRGAGRFRAGARLPQGLVWPRALAAAARAAVSCGLAFSPGHLALCARLHGLTPCCRLCFGACP